MITSMNLPFVNADGTDEGDDFAEVSYILVMTDPDAPSRADLSITNSSVG